ncbi:MAG: hypothetical protein AAGG81_06340 [Chlamydiota bacterium]
MNQLEKMVNEVSSQTPLNQLDDWVSRTQAAVTWGGWRYVTIDDSNDKVDLDIFASKVYENIKYRNYQNNLSISKRISALNIVQKLQSMYLSTENVNLVTSAASSVRSLRIKNNPRADVFSAANRFLTYSKVSFEAAFGLENPPKDIDGNTIDQSHRFYTCSSIVCEVIVCEQDVRELQNPEFGQGTKRGVSS